MNMHESKIICANVEEVWRLAHSFYKFRILEQSTCYSYMHAWYINTYWRWKFVSISIGHNICEIWSQNCWLDKGRKKSKTTISTVICCICWSRKFYHMSRYMKNLLSMKEFSKVMRWDFWNQNLYVSLSNTQGQQFVAFCFYSCTEYRYTNDICIAHKFESILIFFTEKLLPINIQRIIQLHILFYYVVLFCIPYFFQTVNDKKKTKYKKNYDFRINVYKIKIILLKL